MMVDLDDLKRKAEAASKGEWLPRCDYQWNLDWLCNDKDHASVSVRSTDGQPERTICEFRVAREDEEGHTICPKDMAQTAADIEFVASANPQAVLALIAEIERQRAEIAENLVALKEAQAALTKVHQNLLLLRAMDQRNDA